MRAGQLIINHSPKSFFFLMLILFSENTTDWYSSDSKEVNLKSGDMDAIKASIEESRKVVSSGMLETDFTQEKKKKSRWN